MRVRYAVLGDLVRRGAVDLSATTGAALTNTREWRFRVPVARHETNSPDRSSSCGCRHRRTDPGVVSRFRAAPVAGARPCDRRDRTRSPSTAYRTRTKVWPRWSPDGTRSRRELAGRTDAVSDSTTRRRSISSLTETTYAFSQAGRPTEANVTSVVRSAVPGCKSLHGNSDGTPSSH